MPRREPGRLEPFLALSLALHAVLALLLPRGWELPRIRLTMAQGGVVQVLTVPLPPQRTVAPAPGGEAPGRGQPSAASGHPPKPSAVRAVTERPRPAPPASAKPAAAPRPAAQGAQASPAAQAAQAAQPSQPAQAKRSTGGGPPSPLPLEQRLTSPRSPVAMAAPAAPPAAESSPVQESAPQAESAGGDASGQPASQGSGGSGQAGSGPAGSEGLPAEAVLPGGGLPTPSYPKDALSQGLEGRVVLRLTVGADGRVQEAEVVESSGSADFDAVASHFARRLAFRPAATGRGFRLAMEFVFALHRDAQGRVEPRVEVRPVGNLEFLSLPPIKQAVSGA